MDKIIHSKKVRKVNAKAGIFFINEKDIFSYMKECK